MPNLSTYNWRDVYLSAKVNSIGLKEPSAYMLQAPKEYHEKFLIIEEVERSIHLWESQF